MKQTVVAQRKGFIEGVRLITVKSLKPFKDVFAFPRILTSVLFKMTTCSLVIIGFVSENVCLFGLTMASTYIELTIFYFEYFMQDLKSSSIGPKRKFCMFIRLICLISYLLQKRFEHCCILVILGACSL